MFDIDSLHLFERINIVWHTMFSRIKDSVMFGQNLVQILMRNHFLLNKVLIKNTFY